MDARDFLCGALRCGRLKHVSDLECVLETRCTKSVIVRVRAALVRHIASELLGIQEAVILVDLVHTFDKFLDVLLVSICSQAPCNRRSWVVEAESIATGNEFLVRHREAILAAHHCVDERSRLAHVSAEGQELE